MDGAISAYCRESRFSMEDFKDFGAVNESHVCPPLLLSGILTEV